MSGDDWMGSTKLKQEEAALLCARLNLRGGKRRLKKGRIIAGITALYDAVFFGMRYYIARHKHVASLLEDIDPLDATHLFNVLAGAGVFEDPLTFNRFSLTVERALWQKAGLTH